MKGCTKNDRIKNEDIRNELHIGNLNSLLKENRANWKEHLDRMKNERLPLKAFKYHCKGRRNVGRPPDHILCDQGQTEEKMGTVAGLYA